ncbi:hypothetical protein TRFO_09642 [Tritrichomonas foetus]|uniref:SWIM-type domain-containing protein n=1 Tax=Tritrichomonas foetus TaxID=1144522 RepID=A0A1J4JD19_9EUKA|nr:hypothetical protein TRFO_09642 [Tritrichomonas foetus]|eukprot:OHS97086.1 hypothetical protein TRFO_09642 [Tritrichomonas foetus]
MDYLKMAFPDAESLKLYLKNRAFEEGYKLCSRDGKLSSIQRFYCSIGGRKQSKNGHCSVCNYHFSFHLIKYRDASKEQIEFLGTQVDDPSNLYSIFVFHPKCSSNFQHNHSIDPRPFVRNIISTEIKQNLLKFYNIDASISFLQRYLNEMHSIELGSRDISKLISSMRNCSDYLNTEELASYHKKNGGLVFFKDANINEDEEKFVKREAVLSITEEELTNLKRYGDVIFLDMTHFRTVLNWNLVPVVLISNNRTILYGGFLAAASFTKELYIWLLEILTRELEGILKCIISDSDTSLIPAIQLFPGIKNICCTWHKKKKLISIISRTSLTQTQKDEILNLYNVAVTTRSKDKFSKVIEQMKTTCSEVSIFLEHDLIPNQKMFCFCYSLDTIHLGYNVSSPSESANNQIKSYSRKKDYSLLEMRSHFNFIEKNCLLNNYCKNSRCKIPQNELSYFLSHFFEKRIVLEIIGSFIKSKRLILKVSENFSVIDEKNDEIFEIKKNNCSCNKLETDGLPCSHLIKYLIVTKNEFKLKMIMRRWFKEEISENEINEATIQFAKFINTEFKEEILNMTDSITTIYQFSSEEVKKPNQHAVQLSNASLLKSHISQIAYDIGNDQNAFNQIEEILENFMKEYNNSKALNQFEKEKTFDETIKVIEIPGNRRKKMKRINIYDHNICKAQKKNCKLCLSVSHKFEKCPYINNFRKWVSTLHIIPSSKVGCRLCQQKSSHNASNCVFAATFRKNYISKPA